MRKALLLTLCLLASIPVFAQGDIRRPAQRPLDTACSTSTAPTRTALAGAVLTCTDGTVYAGNGSTWAKVGSGGSSVYKGAWSGATAYVANDEVSDRDGVWRATGSSTNSRPVSGNANWTLVSGEPYVDVTLDATALTTSPFQDATSSGAGYTAIAAPGAGLAVVVVAALSTTGAGTVWSGYASANMAYDAPDLTGLSGGGHLIVNGLLDDLGNATIGDFYYMAGDFTSNLEVFSGIAINKKIVIWTPNVLADGTRTLTYRFWYKLLPTPLP